MEPNEEKKKINEDLVVFMRKRSDTEAPRYTARLKTYVDFQHKRRRAAAARRHSNPKSGSITHKKEEPKDKNEVRANNSNAWSTKRKSNCGMSGEHPGSEERMSRRRGGNEEKGMRTRSLSRSHSGAPSDCCPRRRRRRKGGCRKRRRRSRRRRRRRSCRRKRRRRSCRRRKRRRRSCRRRRKRSCSRRRRRRSCRRKRRRRC